MWNLTQRMDKRRMEKKNEIESEEQLRGRPSFG